MKNLFIIILASVCLSSCGMKKEEKKYYDIAAYVWPAMFNEPRYAELGIFKDGNGEWEAIYNSKPKYEGHRQPRVPLWGYLDQSDPKTQEKNIETAIEYGVNVFIFDWYWYENRPFLEDVLNKGFLKAENREKIKFYLMWANHDANSYWDPKNPDKSQIYWQGEVSREEFDGFADRLISEYLKQPNYYTIDGKPVFAIYEISTFIDGMGGQEQARDALESFRAKCIAAGLPGVHFQAIVWGDIPATLIGTPGDDTPTQDNTLNYLGFESLTNYQWVHFVRPNEDYQTYGEKAVAKYGEFDKDFSSPYFPHVSIDWDPSPRFEVATPEHLTGVTPEKFEGFLRVAKEYVDAHPNQPPLITINSWNEWSEGSYLEPDAEFGYGYLKAIKKVFK